MPYSESCIQARSYAVFGRKKIKGEGYEIWQNTNTGLEQSTGTGMHIEVF